jgi:hypothetical protein
MDVPLIEQIKIQAQVLVPLVKALQTGLGEGAGKHDRPQGTRGPVSQARGQMAAQTGRVGPAADCRLLHLRLRGQRHRRS